MFKLNVDTNIRVRGGDGFLGRHLFRKLKKKRYKNTFVLKIENYCLTRLSNIQRMYDDSDAKLVIHLAAVVGGIGANRKIPGNSFMTMRSWESN